MLFLNVNHEKFVMFTEAFVRAEPAINVFFWGEPAKHVQNAEFVFADDVFREEFGRVEFGRAERAFVKVQLTGAGSVHVFQLPGVRLFDVVFQELLEAEVHQAERTADPGGGRRLFDDVADDAGDVGAGEGLFHLLVDDRRRRLVRIAA